MENFNTVPDKGTFGGSVEVINQNFLLAQQEMEMLRNLISPDTEFVTVVATAQTTSVTQVLPETGSTDTVYRVGSWDGIQYNDSVFSEYAWNGTAYIKLSTKSQAGEVYDISENHSGTKYADLTAALGTGGANIPEGLRKGGMSVKYVQSSDNKYVQYRLMNNQWSTNVSDWQGVENVINTALNNSFNFCELEKLPLKFIPGSFNDTTGVVTSSTTAVTTEIASISNIDVVVIKLNDALSVKTMQFNGTSVATKTSWGKRYELVVAGDSLRIAVKRDDNGNLSVSDVVNGSLVEVYVKRQQSAVKTSKELANILNISNIDGVLTLPDVRQGSLNNDGSFYYANDSIHFKDFVEVVPNTTYYFKINNGFRYKVLRSSDGSTIDAVSNWTTAETYNPSTSKYIKVVVNKTGSVLNPYDLYQSGLVISRTPLILTTKYKITDYLSAEKLQKSVTTPTLENYTYNNGFVASDTRLAIRNLIEVDTFFGYKLTSSLTNVIVTHLYFDKDRNYIKSLIYRPTKEDVHVDKSIRYVSLVINKSDNSNISPSDVSVSFTAYTNSGNVEVVKTYAHKKHAQTYYGEKINLGHDFDRDIFIDSILRYGDNNTSIYKQACLYHGGLFYQFYNLGYCAIYNTETKALVRQFYLNGSSAIEGLHCNCATLVKEDDGGIYVCLGAYNSPVGYVYYITNSSCTLIQTINITVDSHAGSNVFVDRLNGKLYIMYKKTGDETKLYINKYELPTLSESTVSLTSTDVVDSYEIDYHLMQDVFVSGNKLYLLYGANNLPIGIMVYNLSDFAVCSQIDLSVWNTEPEGITQYGNEILMSYYSNQTVFQLTFD